MGIIKKESFASSIALNVGMILGFVLILFIYPKYLTVEEFGLIRVLIDMATILSPYVLLGIPNTFVRYYPFYSDDAQRLSLLRFYSLLIPSIGAILFLLLYYLAKPYLIKSFSEQSALLVSFLDTIPVLVYLSAGIQLIRAYYRSELDITTPNIYESVIIRVLFGLSAMLYFYLKLDVAWLVYLFVLSHFIVFVFLFGGFLRKHSFRVSAKHEIDRKEKKELASFGFFVVANSLSSQVVLRIDSWMLSAMAGLAANGIYGIALQMGTVIDFPKRTFSQISTPVIAKLFKQENWNEIRSIYHKTSINQTLIGGFIFILVWINAVDIFRIIPNGAQYAEGIWVLLFIGLSKLFSIATGSTMEILQVSRYYRYSVAVTWSLVITAILTNLWLIPIYGITGAAIASAIAQFGNNFFLLILVWVKLKMSPFKINNLYAWLFLGALFVGFNWLNFSDNPYLNISIKSALLSFITGLGFYFLPISGDLQSMIRAALRFLKRKNG